MRASLVTAALAIALPVLAQQQCSADNHCGASAPCCSPYGFCGTGKYCLGGCEPLFSFALNSCKPAPVCESLSTNFTDLSRVLTNVTAYDGNATKWDWIVDKGHLEADSGGNGARLILTKENGGTLISSTRYVHYGQVSFEMEASKWGGVVTAAITMSDVKDEIDWEWPGNATDQVQTNYFFMGIANYSATDGLTHNVTGNTANEFHTYTLDWQEESLTWLVDGQVIRVLNKTDTFDGTNYKYPTTPSRVQVSIWPAGIESSAKGTVNWAGGMIDWSSQDYADNGYFWNTLRSISINCADAHDSSVTGYEYTGVGQDNVPIIGFTNRTTTLMTSAGYNTASASKGVLVAALAASVTVPLLAWMSV